MLALSPASAQQKKPLAIEDLYLMESVKSPTLFPKEEKLVYERVWIDPKTKQERHSLWLVTGKRENRKPLEVGEPDGRSPVVSPDGEWIAFLSTRNYVPDTQIGMNFGNAAFQPIMRAPLPDQRVSPVPMSSDAAVDVWLYQVTTGKVLPLRERVRSSSWGRVFHDGFYGRVAFSPDSKCFVFVADEAKDIDLRTKEEIENDVEIVRPDQGEGYTGYGPAQIWIVDLPGEPGKLVPGVKPAKTPPVANAPGSLKFARLTNDDIWYGDPQWSPDGKSLVVVANKTKDRESVRFSINKNFDLYKIDVATKRQTQLTTNSGPDVSPRFSPDGSQVAYLSVPRNGPHRDVFNIGILKLGEKQTWSRVVFDFHGPNHTVMHSRPTFPLPDNAWQGNGGNLYYWRDNGSYARLDPESNMTFWPNGNHHFVRNLSSELTPVANLLNDRPEATSENVYWKNDDYDLEAILTLPPKDVAKPPYKLIVYPHGGPHSRSTQGFDFTVQLFAAHGYAVFQPNFRGSTGYGKKFLDANRLDLGGGDMRDILTGIDKLVKDGKVDPKRQFVYGTSYGGFMASWLVGHTHQFRAAVAQNAVTDMNMMYGLSDLQSWTTWELGGLPWEQPERYRKHSPITYADKIKTPTLILHARDDRRCPLPMGKAFHQALLANNVPTQMVIYPNEGHGIRQPRHREDVYRRVLAWFEKYDK